jgi:ABC-type multidrug transport system fused ATPase/permease subunit
VEAMIIPKFETKTRNDMTKEILSKSNNDYSSLAEQFSNMQKVPNTMYRYYENFLHFLFPFVIGLLIFSLYLFWIYIPFGILGFLFFSLYLSLFYFWFVKLCQYSEQRRKCENTLYELYEDILHNHENIIISNTRHSEWERIRQYNLQFETIKNKEIYYSNAFKFIFSLLLCLFFILLFLIFFTRYRLNTHIIPLWKVISFLAILILFCKTSLSLLHSAPKCIYHIGSYGNIMDYFNNMSLRPSSADPSTSNTTTPSPIQTYDTPFPSPIQTYDTPFPSPIQTYDIQFKHVWFRYPKDDRWILKDINVEIPFQSHILIHGSIGSGKSTLGKLLIRLIEPVRGSITIGQKEITEFSSLPISYMNQNNVLFDRSIEDNILYGCQDKKTSQRTLEDIFVKKFPFLSPLSRRVGRSGSNLSGGQRRIIFLLRCYFQEKPIVIVDEPTANIDSENISLVIELLQLLSIHKTLLCISHDPILEPHFPIHLKLHDSTLSFLTT